MTESLTSSRRVALPTSTPCSRKGARLGLLVSEAFQSRRRRLFTCQRLIALLSYRRGPISKPAAHRCKKTSEYERAVVVVSTCKCVSVSVGVGVCVCWRGVRCCSSLSMDLLSSSSCSLRSLVVARSSGGHPVSARANARWIQ